jgi:arylsulfatase A-like enzyme
MMSRAISSRIGPAVLLAASLCLLISGCMPGPEQSGTSRQNPPSVPGELLAAGVGETSGKAGAIDLLTRKDGPAAVVQSGTALSVYLSPSTAAPQSPEPMITFRLHRDLAVGADGFEIEIENDRGRIPLRLERLGPGRWEGYLESSEDEPVASGSPAGPLRVTLTNNSRAAIQWITPRLPWAETERIPAVINPARRPIEGPINIILYVIDTLRADRLALYGHDRPTSPRMDALAGNALVFTNAYSTASHTLPSTSALFASAMPSPLGGVLAADGPAVTTLAERFREAGYRTGALQTNLVVVGDQGYDRGFESYTTLRAEPDPKSTFPASQQLVDAQTLDKQIQRWLDESDQEPFFLYVQSMDAHFPYDAPPPFGEMFVDAEHVELPDNDFVRSLTPERRAEVQSFADQWNPQRYDGCVAYADHWIGRLIDSLASRPAARRTAVIITSDHGEPLGDRDEFRHGHTLYEELVRVPLLILLPWADEPAEIDEIVSQIDLAPTLLDLAGIEIPGEFSGRSLLRESKSMPSAAGELLIIPDRVTRGGFIREGSWKLLLHERRAELFDLESDPAESVDLSARYPVTTGYLTSRLLERSAALREGRDAHSPITDPELGEALKALGYVD